MWRHLCYKKVNPDQAWSFGEVNSLYSGANRASAVLFWGSVPLKILHIAVFYWSSATLMDKPGCETYSWGCNSQWHTSLLNVLGLAWVCSLAVKETEALGCFFFFFFGPIDSVVSLDSGWRLDKPLRAGLTLYLNHPQYTITMCDLS